MEGKIFIIDSTQNSGKPYIDAITHENSGDSEGCLSFENEVEAQNFIKEQGWENWATTE